MGVLISTEKCCRCLQCVKVCPSAIIREVNGSPKIAAEKNVTCINCFHCAAVCTAGAVKHNDKQPVTGGVKKFGLGFAEELKTQIKQRRSYRLYKEEPVDRYLLEEAIKLSEWSASAKNQHTLNWLVIDSPKVIRQLVDMVLEIVTKTNITPEIISKYKQGKNIVTRDAPTIILAYSNQKAFMTEVDAAIAITKMELYLQAQGIGTCWSGYLNGFLNQFDELREMLPAIPEDGCFCGALLAGYPDGETYKYIPERIKKGKINWI